MLVGYSADIEVVLGIRDNVIRIPTQALMPGSRVLVLGADGTLEERKIETGISNWEYTEVKAGLARGERVVTSLEREGVKAGARAWRRKWRRRSRSRRPERNDPSHRHRARFSVGGEQVHALRGVDLASRAANICPSWGRRDRANRRCSISSACSTAPMPAATISTGATSPP